MKTKLVYTMFGAAVISILWICNAYFAPVGDVNGRIIYRHELNNYIKASEGNAVKNLAKDKAFFEEMNQLGITVSVDTVETELKNYENSYGSRREFENILLDTTQDINSIRRSIKKNLLYQKAIMYFTPKDDPNDGEIYAYYCKNTDAYPNGIEAEHEQVLSDLKAEIGLTHYNEYMQTLEDNIKIKVY